MFKKEIEIKPSSNIKSSERRKLQQVLEARMKEIKVPNKLSKAIFNTPDIKKGTLYFDSESNDPVFFQTRNGDVIPTLHGLWASVNPNSDRHTGLNFILTHDAVIDRLVNGANLMIRGCIGPFGEGLKSGEIVAVANYTRPNVAIAIGQCLMDLEGKTNDTAPTNGVAVEIWTVIGDKLTSLGRNMSEVLKEAEENVSKEEVQEVEEADSVDEKVLNDSIKNIGTVADNNELMVESNKKNLEDETKENNDDVGSEEIEKSNIEKYVMTTEDIDEFFRRSILYTLSQEKLELPIVASQFLSSHVLKNLPLVDTNIVNIKKTSWKKTAKFLKAMEKEDYIKLKGKDDNLSIISVATREDPRVSNFVPYKIKKPTHSEPNNNGSTATLFTGVNPLIIKTYIKPTNSARMFFNRLDEKYDDYYTEKRIKELIQNYIKLNPTIISKSNAQIIVPDSVLQEFNIKKPIKRSDLSQKIISHFSPYYAIYREGDENNDDILIRKRLIPKRGTLPKINIIIESVKVGRKVATRINNCERFYVDIEKLSNVLKVKCSGSTTITDAKDPKDGKIINVQGKHDNIVLEVLSTQWGVPLRLCVVDNKTKGRNRR
jgi:translation initiation factor 2D